MGFFSDIKDKIFNRHHEAAAPTPGPTLAPAQGAQPRPAPVPQSAPEPNFPQAVTPTAPASPVQPSESIVDVGAILDQAVRDSGQTLNWRTSIVDLMKAVGIDSSLSSRKELAKELNYTGDIEDSASMNIWLHKQVLQKLAANGGNVPAGLLD